MYDYMMEHKAELLTKNNEEGVRKVYEGVYDYGKLNLKLLLHNSDIKYFCLTSMMM